MVPFRRLYREVNDLAVDRDPSVRNRVVEKPFPSCGVGGRGVSRHFRLSFIV
jgi:hypothetical protein